MPGERRIRFQKIVKNTTLAFSGVWFVNSEFLNSHALADVISGIGFTPKELVFLFIMAHWMGDVKKALRSISERLDGITEKDKK